MEQDILRSCCWRLERFSLRFSYFAIIDNGEYLADALFIRHKVRVWFGAEYQTPDSLYRVILCRCRKRDVDAFLAAARDLPNKMLLCGHTDYIEYCAQLRNKIDTAKGKGGVNTHEAAYPAEKTEQASTKGIPC